MADVRLPSDAPIVPESDEELYNDEYSDGSEASTTSSLTSSILNYQYENGRRYHAYRQGEYVLPNDEREQERLNLHHHICSLVLKGDLYRAPIKRGIRRILDIGTGTGQWAIEMADEFNEAAVTGTDLSPIQPSWIPTNLTFEVDDFELEWTFSHKFDFIHARGIEGSVKNFPRLFRQAYNNLAPGGWFEVDEFSATLFSDDGSDERSPFLTEWQNQLHNASARFGKPLGVGMKFKDWIVEAGFKNVTEEVHKVPLSPWAKDPKLKEIGRYQQANMLEALEAYSLALFTRQLKWSMERVQMLLVGVRKELMDRTLHNHANMYVVYGQREE